MYSVTEVAKTFNVSRQTVLSWIHNGKIKAVRFDKVFRIPKEEVERKINNANRQSTIN